MALISYQEASLVRALHDGGSDVLYVSRGEPVPSYGEEGEDGLLYRRAYDDDQPSGVTVIGFSQSWSHKRRDLMRRIASFLGVSERDLERAVMSSVDNVSGVH